MHAVSGTVGYHAGAAGTVTLGKGERMTYLHVIGGTDSTFAINGGTAVPLPSGAVFRMGLESGGAEWVGVSIVFTATASYFVKTMTAP